MRMTMDARVSSHIRGVYVCYTFKCDLLKHSYDKSGELLYHQKHRVWKFWIENTIQTQYDVMMTTKYLKSHIKWSSGRKIIDTLSAHIWHTWIRLSYLYWSTISSLVYQTQCNTPVDVSCLFFTTVLVVYDGGTRRLFMYQQLFKVNLYP